jgi:hypothetical protein
MLQAFAYFWNAVFDSSEDTEAEVVEPFASIEPHNTPGQYNFLDEAWVSKSTDVKSYADDFLAVVVPKEAWERTSGDLVSSEGKLIIVPWLALDLYLAEYVFTDGTIRGVARMRKAVNGQPGMRFFDPIVDDENVIVFFHPSHFDKKLEETKSGWVRFVEPLNKTRDPFCVFSPTCYLKRATSGQYKFTYTIETPASTRVLPAYNKECARLGKKQIMA